MGYALLLVAILGCKGSDEKVAPKPAEKAAAAEPAPAPARPAAAAKSDYKPDELWTKEVTVPAGDRLAAVQCEAK